jgi:carbonic anhydrase
MIAVSRAETQEDIEAVRDLIRSFFRWAMAEIAQTDNPGVFADLETELALLPGRYGPPAGCLILARLDGMPAGCVAFYGQDAMTMEIKRMFVRPEARGHSVGRLMLEALISEARASGYRRAILSSHHSMHAAHSVYRRNGFVQVPVTAEFPSAIEGIDVCMEMMLMPGAAQP